MRITHVALGAPEGPPHEGGEFDCPLCRVKLLESFRAPATAPEPRPVLPPWAPGERLPHLLLGKEHSRTVDLGPSAPASHLVSCTATPFKYQDGGWWKALCACGWVERGLWTEHEGSAAGSLRAREAADRHRENPDEESDQ